MKKNVEVYTAYCPDRDMTFIMHVKQMGQVKIEYVIGYYYGPPNDEDTKNYAGDPVGFIYGPPSEYENTCTR